MRGVRFERFGEPSEVLAVEDMTTPTPGPGEVLVRLRARSINPSDVLTIRGLYGTLPRLPATPGMEGAGVIEALGEGVEGLHSGQRVIPMGAAGTWRECIVASASQVIPTPEGMPDNVAAQFVVNPLTAWLMVVEDLQVRQGQWLLQTAATSTLGRTLIQIARLRGVKTINAVRRRDAVEELRSIGADEVICTDDEDLVERVREITGGHGVPAAIDAVGGATGGGAVRALARGGTLLQYGALSREPIPLDAGLTIFRMLTVRGFWLTGWLATATEQRRRAAVEELLALMARGEVVPPVEREFDLGDVVEAVKLSESPGRHGKIILVG